MATGEFDAGPPPIPVTEREPNDNEPLANRVELNTAQSGRLSEGDERDVYRFYLPAEAHVRFTVLPPSDAAADLSVDNILGRANVGPGQVYIYDAILPPGRSLCRADAQPAQRPALPALAAADELVCAPGRPGAAQQFALNCAAAGWVRRDHWHARQQRLGRLLPAAAVADRAGADHGDAARHALGVGRLLGHRKPQSAHAPAGHPGLHWTPARRAAVPCASTAQAPTRWMSNSPVCPPADLDALPVTLAGAPAPALAAYWPYAQQLDWTLILTNTAQAPQTFDLDFHTSDAAWTLAPLNSK